MYETSGGINMRINSTKEKSRKGYGLKRSNTTSAIHLNESEDETPSFFVIHPKDIISLFYLPNPNEHESDGIISEPESSNSDYDSDSDSISNFMPEKFQTNTLNAPYDGRSSNEKPVVSFSLLPEVAKRSFASFFSSKKK